MATGRSIDERPAERPEGSTLLLAITASAVFWLSRVESALSREAVAAEMLATVGGAAAVWWIMGRRPDWRRTLDRAFPALAAVWVAAPFLWEAIGRLLGVGDATEIAMLASLQSAAMISAAFSHRRRCQQTATLLTGFLVLFAVVISSHPATSATAAAYGVLLLWWLMARYWERVRRAQAAADVEVRLPVRGAALVIAAGVAAPVALLFAAAGSTTAALHGWLPTSGGDSWSDPYARSGVGDGDAMVAAKEQAVSFGPVESELFLESHMPTLYDMFNDLYGEPPKTKGDQQRNIALESNNERKIEHGTSRTQRSGREFSAVRRPVDPGRRKPLADRDSPAMLYLVGRTPLHLSLEKFSDFDGAVWTAGDEPSGEAPFRLELENGRPWFHGERSSSANDEPLEAFAVKVINLKSQRIPEPPQFAAVHVDKVDQLDFFGRSPDGALCMPVRDHVPQLTVVHLRARTPDLTPLRDADFTARFPAPVEPDRPAADDDPARATARRIARHLTVAVRERELRELAESWTAGTPRGWRQVEAIVDRLRDEFQCDPDRPAPPDCTDVVAHFLAERRGPDYLFATTAAQLLRSLGYPARLSAGFYARPERYDRRSRQTAVLAEDVHVWTEVCVDGRRWVAVEPTPGYAPPLETLTWSQRLARAFWRTLATVRRRAWEATAAAVGLAALWAYRAAACDLALTALFGAVGWGGRERRIRATLRLLEWRAWLVGAPRPRDSTVTNWYVRQASGVSAELDAHLRAFLRAVDRTLYAPPGAQPPSAASSAVELQACRTVARRLHVGRLRRLRSRSIPATV